jgi:hypothetical protein
MGTPMAGCGGANCLNAKKICYLTAWLFFYGVVHAFLAPILFTFFNPIVHEARSFAGARRPHELRKRGETSSDQLMAVESFGREPMPARGGAVRRRAHPKRTLEGIKKGKKPPIVRLFPFCR